jgi:hypothetical protein
MYDPDKRIDLEEFEIGSQDRHLARKRNTAHIDMKRAEGLLESIPGRPVPDLDAGELIQAIVEKRAEITAYDQELTRRNASQGD